MVKKEKTQGIIPNRDKEREKIKTEKKEIAFGMQLRLANKKNDDIPYIIILFIC